MLVNLFWFSGILILFFGFIGILSFVIVEIMTIIQNIYHAVKEYLENEDSTDGP